MSLDVSGPSQVDHGYFEFRASWDAVDLLAMQGSQLDRLKALVASFKDLADELERTP